MNEEAVNKTEYYTKIAEIGEKGECTEEELHYFFSDVQHESAMWFIRARDLSKIDPSKEFLVTFIKGYHLIEMKRTAGKGGIGFGYGSPSCTKNLIQDLEKIDSKEASRLLKWVAATGGNYYIKPMKNCATNLDGDYDDDIGCVGMKKSDVK